MFISIDPERDHAKLIKEYVQEFHPRMIGLRGSLEEVKKVAKLFRVYFMKTNDSPTDYLVDHSIIMVRLRTLQQGGVKHRGEHTWLAVWASWCCWTCSSPCDCTLYASNDVSV